ncbi:hypothetical protein ABZ816_41270 [Actinosynnema sp. NPDC047251]|uniref:Putative secreted protein n=1 Tax=Saccharothrix espanaensis (strain ATCC 51144 / DSM 44229 / JCM 9112 / NBRC 15066 / NRRL 15764) TaxID=1179773 RepID=K0JRB3_SACES|nr:hypothetical protein [Saccharothrix espanaensis]CCH30110.1 putative secreted protein [Saccharothrix espanaensis DSM 44229]
MASTLLLAAGAGLLAPSVAAAESEAARASLVRLTVADVPALGLGAYTGDYGSAVSTGHGENPGDFSDPDGVLDRVGIATRTTRTASSDGKNYAQAQLTALTLPYNGRDLLAVASLDSYAECVPPPVGPWALAYNRSDSGEITVLGHRVGAGVTALPVTGADLGVADLGSGTLTVTVTPHQDPAAQSRQDTARAWLDITIAGSFAGKHEGPIASVRLGEVAANCAPDVTTSPSTPTSPTTGATTTDQTTTTAPTTTTHTTGGTSGTGATTTSPGAVVPGGSLPGAGSGDSGDSSLAKTGFGGLLWQSLAALTLLAAGLGAVVVGRRRRTA